MKNDQEMKFELALRMYDDGWDNLIARRVQQRVDRRKRRVMLVSSLSILFVITVGAVTDVVWKNSEERFIVQSVESILTPYYSHTDSIEYVGSLF